MRAAVTTRYGRPEVVEVREVPTPTPADNEVLVCVRASISQAPLKPSDRVCRVWRARRQVRCPCGVRVRGGGRVPRAQARDHDVRGSRHVTAVCSSANVPLVRSLGDVIVDLLGKAGFPRSLRALKPRGRYLLVGFPEGLAGIARALVTGGFVHLWGRARFITGPADPKQADLVFLRS